MNLNLCFLIGHNEKNTASLLDISAKDAKPDSTQKEVSKIKRRDILQKKKKLAGAFQNCQDHKGKRNCSILKKTKVM